jgi:hypothetical protein
MAPKTRTVFGLFGAQDDAEQAVNLLAENGFAVDQMAFLGPGEVRERNQARAEAIGVGTGTAMGGFAGGLLGALAAATVPGIGSVIAAGALLPTVMGIMTGGATGGTVGGLLAAAGSNDQIVYFVQEVRSGRSLVALSTDRVAEAQTLLLEAGAMEAADVGSADLPEPGSAPQDR